MVIPFILGVYYSFTDWNTLSPNPNWLGLKNYTSMFSDISLLHSFIITVIFSAINITCVNVLAFFFSLLVTGKLKGTNVYRSGFFTPNLIGGLVLGFLWKFIFSQVIPAIGNTIGSEKIADIMFLADPNLALLAIAIVCTWQYAGYIMLIYIAGIQNISSSVIEASCIDGTTYFQRLRYIVFPMLASSFTIAIFLTLINSFKQFDVNVSLTGGGPARFFMGQAIKGTQLFAMNIYDQAFSYNQSAAAQARAVLFFLILVIVSLIQVYFNKKREVEL